MADARNFNSGVPTLSYVEFWLNQHHPILDEPGNYVADFQPERSGTHIVSVTFNGEIIPPLIEIDIGKPVLPSTAGNSPNTITPRDVKRNSMKPGELWDIHGIAVNKQGHVIVTDSKFHRVQVSICLQWIRLTLHFNIFVLCIQHIKKWVGHKSGWR